MNWLSAILFFSLLGSPKLFAQDPIMTTDTRANLQKTFEQSLESAQEWLDLATKRASFYSSLSMPNPGPDADLVMKNMRDAFQTALQIGKLLGIKVTFEMAFHHSEEEIDDLAIEMYANDVCRFLQDGEKTLANSDKPTILYYLNLKKKLKATVAFLDEKFSNSSPFFRHLAADRMQACAKVHLPYILSSIEAAKTYYKTLSQKNVATNGISPADFAKYIPFLEQAALQEKQDAK